MLGDARRIPELLQATERVDVLVGGDDWVLEGCLLGAAGWISGVAVVVPRECVRLWDLGRAGQSSSRHGGSTPSCFRSLAST